MTAAFRRVPVSIRVAVVIAVVILVAFLVSSSANNQREQALLQHDASQAATVEQFTLSNVLSVLDTLATTTTISDGSTRAFQSEAQDLVHAPVSVALAKAYLSQYVVFASVGPAFRVDQLLNDGVFSTLRPGGVSVVTGPVVSSGNQSTATFAVGPPLVPSGDAIFLQFSVNPFVATILPTGPDLSDLRVALYGSTNPARGNLVVTTSSDAPPWQGPVVNVPVAVGNGTWTLVANAREPLIGSFASIAPLILLVLGLLLALSMGVAVELFTRRRKTASTGTGILTLGSTEPQKALLEPQFVDPGAVQKAESEVAQPQTVSPHVVEPRVSSEETTHPIPRGAPSAQGDVPNFAAVSSDEDRKNRGSMSRASSYADWRPDPFGRAELRRFFLGSPTSLVRDGGSEYYDPILSHTEHDEGQIKHEPVQSVPGDEAASSNNEASVEEDDSESTSDPQKTDLTGTFGPALEMHDALEMVAARVAEAIAEEIDGLFGAPSPLNEAPEPNPQPAPSSTPTSPALPPPPPASPMKASTPPPPRVATTPAPAPTPLPPPSGPAVRAPSSSASPASLEMAAPLPPPHKPPNTSTAPAAVPPVTTEADDPESRVTTGAEGVAGANGTAPTQQNDTLKLLLGTASTVWRRIRGNDRPRS